MDRLPMGAGGRLTSVPGGGLAETNISRLDFTKIAMEIGNLHLV